MSFWSKRTIAKDVAPNSGNGTSGISSQLDRLQVQSQSTTQSTVRRASHSQNQVHNQVASEQAHKASLTQSSVVPKIAPNFGPFGNSVSKKAGQSSMSQKIQGKGQVTHEGKQGLDSQPLQRRTQESSLESGQQQHPQETTPRIDGQKSSMKSAIMGKEGLASQPPQRHTQKSSMESKQQRPPTQTTPRIDLQIPHSSIRHSPTSLMPNASQSHVSGKELASQPPQRHTEKSSMESKQQHLQQANADVYFGVRNGRPMGFSCT